MHHTIDDWIAQEAIPFSNESPESANSAIDRLVAGLDDSVDLLGFGEALHGGEEILTFRNRLFQRLVEAHGYAAIALESSFPRSRVVNDFVLGHRGGSYDEIQQSGFSHGFGRLEANRELLNWMRQYNADSHSTKIHFYGFDSPTEMGTSDSPRQLLNVALDFLITIDEASGRRRRERIDSLLGADAAWENPEAAMDPAKSIGLSFAAIELRIETEELISELQTRRPECVAKSDASRYAEAAHHAAAARQMLNHHAAVARESDRRLVEILGIRDAIMADNLAYIVSRERSRGKVLAFAHNSHLKCGAAQWQLGPRLLVWSPAGSHLRQMLGDRYAIVGSAIGASEANGIPAPEPQTLESRLAALPQSAAFIPTHRGFRLSTSETASIPARTGKMANPSYTPLTAQSLTDFDWLAAFHSITYHRGAPPVPAS